jgi:hypothetical protein
MLDSLSIGYIKLKKTSYVCCYKEQLHRFG